MSKPALALVFCFAAISSPSFSGDTVQYGPAPDWVHAVTLPADASPATEAPARSVLKNFQIKFTATTSELFSEAFVRIQTPQGLQAMSSIVLPWKPDTDVLTVHRFRLLRGKEVIDVLGSGQKFEVLRREHNLEYSALDGVLSAALQPNGMEVGDVLDIAFTLTREYRVIPSPEMVLMGFVETPPAERIEVRAIWDKSLPLNWRNTVDVIGAKQYREGNTNELRWTATDIATLDQPTNEPARYWLEPAIEFTNYKSWSEISRRLSPLYVKAAELQANSPLKAEAATIAAASADPVQRLEAALKLAQERVRYVFLGMAEGGIKPANADETWQRRFGDCKGKTVLLIALLHELGIEAEPVAVNTRLGDAIQLHLPLLSAFDHVIVRAKVAGQTYWLDGAESESWRRADMVTPDYHWGLPLTEHGDDLVAMNAAPAAAPQLETDTEIDARAGLHTNAPFTVTTQMHGAQAAALHGQLAQMTPAIREQALKKYWKDEYDFVEPKAVREEYHADAGLMKLIMEGTANMDWSGYHYITDGMRTGGKVDYSRTTKVNPDAPFVLAHPLYKVTRQRITLPEKGDFTLQGKGYDASLAGYHYIRHAKIENRVFTGESSVQSLVGEVPAALARATEKTMNDMWSDKLEIVATNYTPTDADVAALRGRKFDDRANLDWRGNVFLNHGDYQDALADFDAIVKLDPKDMEALAMRGLAQYWLHNYTAARADLDAALAKEPRNAIALRGLGVVDRMEGKFPEAIANLSESLKADPASAFALSNRAYVYAASDEPEKALADAAEAIRVSPHYVEMYGLRAWILAADGHDDAASKELQTMIKECPDSTYLQWTLADNYGHLGRHAEAVAAMDNYIKTYPDAASYLKRAAVRDPADVSGRLADVDAALAKKPGDPQGLNLKAELLGDSGNHEAAIAAYSELWKTTTKFTEKRRLLTLRGVQYSQAGKQSDARKDFAAALADDPDGDAYNNYCWILAAARIDLPAALSACDSALKVAPKDAAYLDSRGFVLLQLGRFDEAVASYDAALAQRPKAPASLYGRGVAKNRRCKCAEGAKDLGTGASYDPGVPYRFAKSGLAP